MQVSKDKLTRDGLYEMNIDEVIALGRERMELIRTAGIDTVDSVREELRLIYSVIDNRINVAFFNGQHFNND